MFIQFLNKKIKGKFIQPSVKKFEFIIITNSKMN